MSIVICHTAVGRIGMDSMSAGRRGADSEQRMREDR